MNCPSCGAENTQAANFCSNCGFALVDNAGTAIGSAEEAPCRQCGAPVPLGAQFCGNCGATHPHDAAAEAEPSKSSAAGAPKKIERPLVPPPPKVAQPGSPVAVPEGWPDVTEELAEVRFYLLQGEDDEAKDALRKLQDRFPGHPDLDTDLVLDRSVMRAAPPDPNAKDEAPEESAKTMVAPSKRGGADESAKTIMVPPKPEDPDESAKTMVPASKRDLVASGNKAVLPEWTEDPDEMAKTTVPGALTTSSVPGVVAGTVSATVVKSAIGVDPKVDATVRQPRPMADDEEAAGKSPDAADDSDEGGFPAEVVAKSEGWGNAPAPGGTVISRAPSADAPNVLPVGSESSQVQLTEVAEAGSTAGPPSRIKHDVSATVIKESPRGSSAADEPLRADQTIVAEGLQAPKPFLGGAKAGGEWLEGGRAEELVVAARPGRRRGLNQTMVPPNPDQPEPPTPFGGEVPPGSTMVPGTTPPKGGFPPMVQQPDGIDFEHRLPAAARTSSTEAVRDDAEELSTAEVDVPDPDGPLTTPMPHVPTTQEVSAGPGVDPPTKPGLRVEEDESKTAEMKRFDPAGVERDPQTPQGTVITANPLPPAPYEGRPPSPILPVRLVMLGARGQPVAERTLSPGDELDIGRDLSEPWGDDEYLEQRHTRLLPGPGGGVTIDEGGGYGPVYRQIEHRRQIRSGDQFRVGQSLVTFYNDEGGSRLDVLFGSEGEPQTYELGEAGLILGREEGDVTFPDDTYVSSSHCRFSREAGTTFVEDLGSSNGTYVRVRVDDTVEFGALLLVGHTQFRIQALPPE
jgi:hypothetical protein